MKILAIDPGKTVGWAVIKDGVLVNGNFWPGNRAFISPSEKLAAFGEFIGKFLHIDAFAWEYQFTSARAKDLWEGQAQIGELVAACLRRGIPTCAVTPGEWKSLIAGNGHASYALVKKVLRLRLHEDGVGWNWKISNHEVAAIGIGLAAWAKRFQFEAKGESAGGDSD